MRILLVIFAAAAMTRCPPGGSREAPDRDKTNASPRTRLPAPNAPGGGQPSPPADAGPTRLEVSVAPERGAPPRTATLECGNAPRATGFIEDATSACRAVEQSRDFLVEGSPADRACTMIYGGPQVATITGTVGGAPVRREVTRTNGCGISDWSALAALLGAPEPQATTR